MIPQKNAKLVEMPARVFGRCDGCARWAAPNCTAGKADPMCSDDTILVEVPDGASDSEGGEPC